MRTFARVLLMAGLCAGLAAGRGHDLFACGIRSKNWVAGTRLPPSGLFFRWAPGAWTQQGQAHPLIEAADYDPRDPMVMYLAGGNGCLRSRDAGRTWAITTGETLTELRDVSVDPNRPDDVYAAVPDGVAVSRNQGRTWQRLNLGVSRRFTKTVRVDRRRAGRVLAGTEQAILLSEDGGGSWRRVSEGDMFTHLEQSPHDPDWWLATAQRGGLATSRDGGRTWQRAPGVPADQTLYHCAFDPAARGRIAVAAWGPGVLLSEDGGSTWTARNRGLPSRHALRVVFDPDRAGRLFASLHEEALYVSDDAGGRWRREGLEGSVIHDLVFVPRPQPPSSREAAFRGRARQIVEHYARPAEPASAGYPTISAKLYLKEDAAWASRRLLELLREPTGDMFWMFPVTAIAYLDRGQLTAEARSALRRAWQTYAPFRGDTENHWVLYYTCLYLMAQLWPDEPAESWYTGKTSRENFQEAERWLRSWMNLTWDRGQGEYDCTHYVGAYLLSLSYLTEWAKDPVMKQRARLMLEWIIADYAADNLNGLYVGAHARTDDRNVLEKWYGYGSDIGWLLFGMGYPLPGYGYATYHYAVSSAHVPPEVLHRIATDRSQPHTHRELKRTRYRWRFFDETSPEVYKTTHLRREYAVGSDQGGVLQPVQQHSWDVTWAVDDPRGAHNTLFSLHPYWNERDLQAYYTRTPDALADFFARFRPSYKLPDKFLGGSPYEQVVQDQDTLIALYNIPEGTSWPHVNGFFSKDLARVEEHPSGWIFCQGGEAYMAYRPLARYEWRPIDYHGLLPGAEGGRWLFSPHRKNGTVVQAAAAGEFADFAAFQRAILALPFEATLEPAPRVRMRSLRGAALDVEWGKPPDRRGWKLFDSPYLQCERGSRRVEMRHGRLRRVLDFNTLAIEDQ